VISEPLRLLCSTSNPGKAREFALAAGERVTIEPLAGFRDIPPCVEDGATFAENAIIKARHYGAHTAGLLFADDSGLEVDALGGAPGVFSARFSGPGATDASNNRLLLEQLGDTPPERRTARFVCHMAVSDPQGDVQAESHACCCGRIRFEPTGGAGFGYDPLFEIVEYHRTFAEFGLRVKAVLSHRARAAAGILPHLMQLADAKKI
jgi:XTP/dITP diphosphohydrolase